MDRKRRTFPSYTDRRLSPVEINITRYLTPGSVPVLDTIVSRVHFLPLVTNSLL
jgi:hypothetical protein